MLSSKVINKLFSSFTNTTFYKFLMSIAIEEAVLLSSIAIFTNGKTCDLSWS